MIQCARCSRELRIVHESGIEIDVCDHCSSAWLDQGELNQIISRAPKDSRLDVNASTVQASPHPIEDLNCPRCGSTSFVDLMFDQFQVSRCEGCGGMHIDHDCLDKLSGLKQDDETSGQEPAAEEAVDEKVSVGAQIAGEFVLEGLFELVFHLLVAI